MPYSRLVAACLLTLVLSAARAEPAEIGSDVSLPAGSVHGLPRDDHGVLAFKGIPFAAPPVGELRWKAPQPVAAWTGVRDATHFGNRCLSAWKEDKVPGPPRSEDCLSLNIWTAAHQADEKRPVMVWIHGGGFQFGSSAEPSADGAHFAQKGVVLVSLNYRLGVMGFLAHPELDKEGASGDYGLQDQLAALKWVKANIGRFGGNPDNVTVFGESAGAHAIGILMASPLASGLMSKAIGESGAFWDSDWGPLASYDEAHALGIAFAQRVGAASLSALRAMPAETLNAAALWSFDMLPEKTSFSPNIDRFVVPMAPATRYLRGEQLHIPLLAGWNDAEHYPFGAFALPHRTAAEFREAAERWFGKDRIAEFLKFYPADNDVQAKESAEALNGDMVIAEQTWYWLELQLHSGQAPVYGYKFSYTSPYLPIASHIGEIPFVFGTLTPEFIVHSTNPPGDADRAVSETMMSYWVNFAAKGNPNGPGLPNWPSYGKSCMIEGIGKTTGPIANPQADRFRFLASYRTDGMFPPAWRDLTH